MSQERQEEVLQRQLAGELLMSESAEEADAANVPA